MSARRPVVLRGTRILVTSAVAFVVGCADPRGLVSTDTANGEPPTSHPAMPPLVPPAAAVDDRIAFVSTRDGFMSIYVATSDSIAFLTEGENPAWSWDGKRIAFDAERPDGKTTIRVINADGSGERDLGLAGDAPAWSRDDKRLAFVGEKGIHQSNVDGSGLSLLVSNDFMATDHPNNTVYAGTWSPDGKRFAFARGDDWGPSEIYVANADGSNPHRLLGSTVAIPQERPRWSPDGSMIAFETWQPAAIATVSSLGLGLRVQLGPTEWMSWSDWAPDGHSLMFSNLEGGTSYMRIFAMDLATGSVHRVIPDASKPAGNYWDGLAASSRVASERP